MGPLQADDRLMNNDHWRDPHVAGSSLTIDGYMCQQAKPKQLMMSFDLSISRAAYPDFWIFCIAVEHDITTEFPHLQPMGTMVG